MQRLKIIKAVMFATALTTVPSEVRAERVELKNAVETAMQTHPEINQAIENKTAIEFEREQAQGMFYPQISVEGSAGGRRLENATRRSLGIANQELFPMEVGLRLQQIVYDGGSRQSELTYQASRTDGAAFRVEERAQFVALQVSRQYLDYMLQQRIAAASEDNIAFHDKLVNDLKEGVNKGSISVADQQQAQERLQAARTRLIEAKQELVSVAASFRTLTGLDLVDGATLPSSLADSIPASLEDSIVRTREANPKVREAQADLDAAYAMVKKSKAEEHPTMSLEGNARFGDDIDGFRGQTNDLQGGLVVRWDVFNGGIKRAKVQEMLRREREVRFRLEQASREAEEDIRVSWNAWDAQGQLVKELDLQSEISDELLRSYRAQFNIGRRSLLDVLDAQNTRYNVQVRAETARFAQFFAEFKVLAALNGLLQAMQVQPPQASQANARVRFKAETAPTRDDPAMRVPK